MELYEPVWLGPLEVPTLSMTLPGLKFPLDLSGGVGQFRHRRGQLEHLELRARPESIARSFERGASQVMGVLERPVAAWLRPGGLTLGATGREGALAFDLLWAPDAGHARVVIANARGAGLRAPALGIAMKLVDAALGDLIQRQGRVVRIERAAARIVSELLPRFGARAPSTAQVAFGDFETEGSELLVVLQAQARQASLSVETVRSLETAGLAAEADELLLGGDLDLARQRYLEALERAPRHPDLALAVAEIDARVGGRAEAALGLLVESMPATQAGLVGAELLASVGDLVGAREAVAAAAVNEAYAPIAALGWARLAEHEPAPLDRLGALDRACARAPALFEVRWRRLEARLARRDAEGALADAQHLEAAAHGALERHRVCSRAARAFLDAGQKAGAGRLFERALRYLPDDPVATAGLARSFMEANQPLRAASLLERAVTLSEKKGVSDPAALLDLAKVLARQLRDLPAAVHRLRQVPLVPPYGLEARALEGRYRAKLGDLAGASLAYAELSEALEVSEQKDPRAKRWLMEAARFEEDYQRDVCAAERHLALALRLTPDDEVLGRRYRRVAARVMERARERREPPI